MRREFNVTGNCTAKRHFMADISGKLRQTMAMVERGDYFIINRPRQYGKTTMLFHLSDMLNQSGEYIAFRMSFEGIGDKVFEQEEAFCPAFWKMLERWLAADDGLAIFIQANSTAITNMETLSEGITQLAKSTDKKLVVLIDEVDKSSNNQLFVSFLGMLRDKFLSRDAAPTFHSVVLAGVHDVKTLKLKLRPDAEKKLNSPWNIAAEFRVDMNFQVHEIEPMLQDYCQERGLPMDTRLMAEQLVYYTSGYPYLVSKLCKIMDEEVVPQLPPPAWTPENLALAVQYLLKESENVNFDSLFVNLENNPDLAVLVRKILLEGETVYYSTDNHIILQGILYGVFARPAPPSLAASAPEVLRIHNRVYRERIANYWASRLVTSGASNGLTPYYGTYTRPDQSLDMEKLLLNFQIFMREEYSKKDRDFLEREGRLVFLAFLKSILNGRGYTFKEPQISEEKRLDIAVTYMQYQYLVELKLWRGQAAHEDGLRQLADYLQRQNLAEGWLVIFDHSKRKRWRHERSEVEGKKILAIWV